MLTWIVGIAWATQWDYLIGGRGNCVDLYLSWEDDAFDSTLCGGGLCPIYFVAIWYDYSLVPRTGAMVVDEGGGKLTWGVDFNSLVIFLFLLHFGNVWPYLIVMPLLLYMFYRIHVHYNRVAAQLRVVAKEKAAIHDYDGATVIVLVSNVTRVTAQAVNYARSIGDYVIAMHVSFDENPEKEHKTAAEFKETFPDVRFVDIHSSYRSIATPTLRFCDVIAKRAAERNFSTTVLVPQFVPKKPWQNILHNQTSLRLRAVLNSRENIIVSTYNYHLKE